jgi:stage II sporulation protein D
VNELPLETYLYSVVSSEMPSAYPAEALKAQAVCARTYAVNCVRSEISANPYFDLNDSVSYQVYNNYAATEASRAAADATTGEILTLEEVQYYSTSCLTEHREDLDSEAAFAAFLEEEPEEEAQYGSPWLRWSVRIPVEKVLENLACTDHIYETEEDHAESTKEAENECSGADISVASRRGDGQVQALIITCGEFIYRVEGEYQIRQVLGDAQAEITLRDGGTCSGMQLLPSAFFILEQEEGDLVIRGGGYGHGNGMSQCGAAEMASEGLDYREILEYYYGVAACETIAKQDHAAAHD